MKRDWPLVLCWVALWAAVVFMVRAGRWSSEGAGPPPAGECASKADVGKVYKRREPDQAYVCVENAYRWQGSYEFFGIKEKN